MNATLTHTKQGRLSSSNTTLLLLFFCSLFFANSVSANVTILRATGGSISADKAANAISPTYTTLGNVRLSERATADFATGTNLTLTLTTPTGWNFNPLANVTVSATAGRNITSPVILSKTTTVITVQFNVTATNLADVLTISGIQVWATDGARQSVSGNITRGGTATIAGCVAGANLGTLSTTVGAARLVVTLPGQTLTDATTFAGSGFTGTPSTRTASTSFSLTRITACDQFYNRVTSYTGAKTISYTGPGTAVNAPTFTTAVNFTSGRSSTTLTTTLRKAEITNITVTDGTVVGVTSANFTVQPGTHNNFLVEAVGGGNIGTQIAGTAFSLRITARDIQNNTNSSGTNIFSSTVSLTSTGTLTTGGGTSAAFVAGVLSGKVVNISNAGSHTITVTRTSGIQTGTSNTFTVENPVPTVSVISSPCRNTGTSNFTLTVTGTNFNASTIIRVDGVNRTTTYVSATSVQATILAADLSVDGEKAITAFNPTPGGGTSLPAIMTVSTIPVITSQPTSQVICSGSTASFSVAATGFGISYQWKKNGIALVDGGNVSGVNTATLTISNADAGDVSSNYTVSIQSACFADVVSTSVSLNVDATTQGGVLPLSTEHCIGSASGNLNLTGNVGAIVQWEWSTDNFTTAGNIISNTTNSNSYTNLLTTTYYRALVKSGVCPQEYSSVATVVVNSLPLTPTDPTASTPQCIDSTVTLTRLSSPPGETWFWQLSAIGTSLSESGLTKYVTASGTYFLRSQNDLTTCWSSGAGSVSVNLNASSTGSQTLSVCDGTNVTLPDGNIVTTTGVYITHLYNSAGCDSTITTNLTVIPNTSSTQTISICDGATHILPDGATATATGVYISHVVNAAGCDSTITTNLAVIPNTTSTQTVSICDGATHTLPDGATATVTGTYISHISNAAGCDSTITTNLTVIPNTTSTQTVSICDGATHTLPDGATATVSGVFVSHISNAAGCDSTITTNLTVIPNTASTQTVSICDGATHTLPDGATATVTGTYISHIANAAGCDSTITTNLTVIPNTSSTQSISICDGATHTLPDGATAIVTGTYVSHISNAAGCDSTITTNLTVIPNTTSTQTVSICDGATHTLPDGATATVTGTYVSHISNTAGCDSTITTNLTVIPNTTSTQTVSICDGATHTLPDGASATVTGTYVSHIANVAGCDSTVTTNLTVIPNTTSTQAVSICDGATHTLPDGATATVTGTYISHISNAAGCDSTITTNLTVIPNTTSTQTVSICDGATHTLPDGATATVTGTYVSHIANAAGCDSTITTNLTVIPNTTSTQTVSICDGATHILPDGAIATVTGTYVSHISNASGCDSTITTNLTVIANTTSTQTVSICDGATHTLPDGATATVSGVYISHIANDAGCDSTITTNLTVIPNTTSTQTVSICDGATHTLPDGATATVTGTYVSHIANAAGCDSTITTNLTVIPNTTSTQTVSICDGATHTLPDGATVTVTGTYVSHIANAAGCDSTITTNLTVIPNTTSTQTVSICNGATHVLPDGASATVTGTYVSHISNAAGCDSTITTDLTVIPNTTSTQIVSTCDGATHSLPDGATATTTGVYISHVANAAGCDSTITTNLTVIPNTTSTQTVSICDGATHTLPDGATATVSGVYISHIANDAGCDSTITTNLTVIPNTTSTQTVSICDGATLTLPGGATATTTGVYISHVANAAGCDSTITTNLTVIPNTTSTQTVSICDGATHTLPDGATATVTGTYVSHISNSSGCDSTITTNLTVIPNTTSTQTVSICDGATHTLPDGAIATTTGVYISNVVNAAGCDSTITTNLTVIPNTLSTQTASICDGATHTLPDGATATVTGTYISHISNAAGCDSTITTNLTVIPNTTSTQTVSICNGATHTLPDGASATVTGTYVSHIANASGCDSTITTNLTVISNTASTQIVSICDGVTQILPDGATATTTGVYISHVVNAAGCDSTVTTNLTVIPNTTSTQTVSICDGATHTLPDGATATVTGTYVSHIANAAGCDSTITTNLTVIPNTTSTQAVSICNGATHTLPDGATATVTGTYVSHISNASGCDSTITTTLTIIPNTTSTQTVSICDGATHTLPDGATATVSGIYISHISNAAGCDSTVTTNLTVIPNTTSTQTVSICDGATHTLPDGATATVSGVFVSHISNAAGCDSTITTNLTVIPNTSSTQTISICDGATHTLPDGASATVSGTYVSHIANAAGCDSTITTNLTVIPNTTSTQTVSICDGATHTLPDGATATVTGTYVSHISNAAGCDSTITTNLTVIPNTTSTQTVSICDGATHTLPDGASATVTGTYVSHISNAAGCDSTITTNLTVIPNTSSTQTVSICDGATHTLPDGATATVSGVFVSHIANAAGCDSTITTNLTVIPNTTSTQTVSICDGATHTLPDGATATVTGTYVSHISNAAGCDSTITTNLTVIPNTSSTQTVSICDGATHTLPDGATATMTGTYVSHISNAAGCDSTITTNLTVIPNTTSTQTVSICDGATHTLPDGASATVSGTYVSHIANASGCDSTITTNLTVIPNTSSTQTVSICDGATHTLPDGATATVTGTYVSHIANAAGCDSTITTNLTVIANTTSTQTVSICDGATHTLPDGATATVGGVYISHIANDAGCDSTITTNLTVIPNTTSTQTVSICDGATLTLPGGATATTTGVYISHVANAAGCDSTITTNLTVIPNTTSTQTVSICDGATHTLPDGATATVTGTYISHILNAAGCDSTITTNLTVIPNTTSTQTVSICDGATHTLPDGATATVTGTYVSHIANAAGCDSTITTNLTVIPNTTSTQTVSICNGATHVLPDGATATVTGTYVSHISNAAGCDSTITTNLTVIPNTSSTQTISICDGATHTLPDGATSTTTGVYISIVVNVAGCDSTITTNLTVIPNTTSTQTVSICDGATHTLPDGATATVTGTYISHISNAAGCDSTITTNLTVIPNTSSTQTISICDGATHTLPDGATATTTGVYISHVVNVAGCDSTITTNLTVIPNTTSTQTVSICDGASHTLPDGATATVTGTYVSHIANAAGCDSTITTNLTVIANTTSTQTVSICDGATHTLPDGATATVSGVYISHIANDAGCDSTITTNLTVIPNTTSTQTVSICDGATHTLPDGATATVTGTYVSHIANAAGCDSTITTNLTVIPNTTSTQTVSICDGATHTLPDGASATVTGTYVSHIANAAGCDSTITTNLTVIPNTSSTQTVSICDGATHTLPDGASATVTGTYVSHIANAAGCDSTITTNLTVIPNTISTQTVSICVGSTHTLPDGVTATVTGIYTSHILNAAGCDSTITTNLTVIPNTTSTQTVSICDGATHTLPDGATATTTGVYISHVANAAGCDSTITTNLTVIPNTTSTQTVSICDGATHTLPDGATATVSGVFVSHIANAAGCDSTITTNLTVIPNTSSTQTVSICDGATHTLPDGATATVSGVFVSHIANAAGCDSTITTNLTVIPNTTSTQTVSICDGATHTLPDGATATVTGTYVSHIANAAGCDSTITTNLTVIPNTTSTQTVSICDGATHILPDGATATVSGVFVSHISNAAGCDSTITTNLTVIPNTTSTQTVSICDGATHILPDGASANVTGIYTSQVLNAAGCDSVITTNLTVLTGSTSIQNVSICDGSGFILPDGVTVTTAGTYVSTIPLGVGCDSVITTNLTLISNSSSSQTVTICDGSSHSLPDGSVATTTGVYVTHIANTAGCDSTITTDLTVLLHSSATQNISICNGTNYTLPDGTVINSAGTYISHIENSNGCDSAITTIVSGSSNSSSTQTISICAGQSFTLPDGNSVNTSGVYSSHLMNTAGCDSLITTNLTVLQSSSSTHSVTICNGASYTLVDGTIVSTPGVFTANTININGCDSTITTTITVSATTYASANATICNGYNHTLPDGNSVSTAGTYISIIANASGCDSVITTTLNVITNSTSSRTLIVCAGNALVLPDNSTVYPLVSGSYITTLVNGNYLGCDSIITTNVTVRSLPTLITNITQIKCFGGTASVALTPTGGTAPYTFNNQSTTGLVEGTYLFTLTDVNGCIDSANVVVNPAPTQLNLTATPNQILCFNGRGSVTLTATGGTAPYIYGGSPRTNLTAGTFNYTVRDFKGCTKTASAQILPSPSRVTGSMITTPTGCIANTGTAKVTPGGGRPPYTFTWNTNPVQTTNMAVGLGAGTYVVTVRDSNGCSLNVTAIVANPSLPRVLITGIPAFCPSSSTTICATGGMSSYLWSNGDTTQCTTISTAGVYTVQASNIAGCTASATANVTQGTLPISSITGNDFICPGGATTLTASPGFTYRWNNGSTRQFLSVRAGGTYTVTVKNSTGCTSTATRVVTAPMKASVKGFPGNCANGYQGYAVATVTGGVAPFTYLWNTGQTTSTITGLRAGSYNVRVTDAKGCMAILSTTIAVTKSPGDFSRIVASFNNNDIAIGRTIWFSAVVKVNYTGAYPLMLSFTDQNIASSRFNVNPKVAKLVITDTVSIATTTFNGIEWMTVAPPNISGNYFISGYAHQLPSTILRNLTSITWKGVWTANRPGVTNVEWKWSAAVYSTFNSDLNQLGVKAADGDTTTAYANNDPAGSPENYKLYTVAGARGTGIGDYVGIYSGPITRIPCTNVNFGVGGNRMTDQEYSDQEISDFEVNAFPNPFSSKTTIEFMSAEYSGMTSVEVFTMSGQKVASLFNGTIEAGSRYSVEFNAEELPVGMYLYRISNNNKVINGRLILVK